MIQFKYHKKSIMVNNHSSLYNEIRGSIYSETRGSVWSETRGSVKNETRGSITVKFPPSLRIPVKMCFPYRINLN